MIKGIGVDILKIERIDFKIAKKVFMLYTNMYT